MTSKRSRASRKRRERSITPGTYGQHCCDDGLIEIDNSATERALRDVAIGRRNCLFAGADSGGDLTGAIYSLLGTVKLNGVDSEAWMRHVLTRIADYPVDRVYDFCPGTARPSSHRLGNRRLALGVTSDWQSQWSGIRIAQENPLA